MKGRFAPSPTGRMHLGNAFSALLSWLSARSQGGEWLLRIEDLDQGRSRQEFIEMLEDDLRWLGLDWDEGGHQACDGMYCQSRRASIYDGYLERLSASGAVYPCWCSRADLLASSAPHESDGRVVYSGKCRPVRLGGSYDGTVRTDRRPAMRLFVPDEDCSVVDLHYGPVCVNLARDCGDFILRRADGTASYQLAVVVDDALMGVTEVVRGNDLLLSSPQQAYLHRLLGFEAPNFAHLPLLCASDGRRLCKRDKDLDFAALRQNHSPEQVIGKLAFLAGITDRIEPLTASELIPLFSWDKVPHDNILL